MLRHVVVSALCLIPLSSFGQTYFPAPLPSSQFLQSGVMLGTGHERNFSLRTQALGEDFSGIIEDRITDLYRNPAFFAGVDSPMIVGELIRPQGTKSYYSQQRTDPALISPGISYGPGLDRAQSSTGLRYAYISNFGILVRGNYDAITASYGDPGGGLFPLSSYGSYYISQYGFSRSTRNTWGDIQLSYGFVPSKDVYAGVSYTFGLIEAKNEDGYFSTRTSYEPIYNQDTTVDRYGYNEGTTSNLRSHTIRFGLRWDNPDNQIEAMGTVEALNGTTELSRLHNDEWYYSYQPYPDSARRYASYQGTFGATNSTADVMGINARLDFRYHKMLPEGRTFTAQIGASVAHFSSDDIQRDLSHYISTSGQYTTSGSTSLSGWSRTAPPDGFGLQVNASAGWTLPFKPFMLAAATVANVSRITYDYDARTVRGDTSGVIQGTRDSLYGTSGYVAVAGHSNSVLNLRLAIPVAMEVEALNGLDIRAGWVPQYVRSVNKDDSNDNGFRNTSDKIDVATMSFGIGYQILDKLRVDMVNYGDIAQPRSWNIAAQYTF